MGSSYFYLEFLIAFLSLLKTTTKFQNPAILALEYTLVPTTSYPTQLHQTVAGYRYLLSIIHPSKIVLCGDSAGGTLILSLLLYLSQHMEPKSRFKTRFIDGYENGNDDVLMLKNGDPKPALAVLISPWTTLLSPLRRDTSSDYLSTKSLDKYAHQYIGSSPSSVIPSPQHNNPLLSPGTLLSHVTWLHACPTKGFYIPYGSEEVFAPETRNFVAVLNQAGVEVKVEEGKGIEGIHAWVVASLFLAANEDDRLKGLRAVVSEIAGKLGNHSYDT